MTYYTYKFVWPATDPPARTVTVTGNFDNWAQVNEPLLKKEDGHFEGVIQFKEKQKLTFKFVVNGSEWVINSNYKSEWDNGNENNVVEESELKVVEPFTEEEEHKEETKIEQDQEEEEEDQVFTGEELEASPHTDKETELSQVSSYSAVSIPASTLEFVTVTPAATEEAVVLEDAVEDEEFGTSATPILSLSNSRVAPATPTTPGEGYDAGVDTPPESKESNNPHSILNSINGSSGLSHQALKPVDILKAPGAFPPSPASLAAAAPSASSASPTKSAKPGLIGRFRSLFRY